MKKLLILLMLTSMTSIIFADSDLRYNISKMIIHHQVETELKTGYKSEAICWESQQYICPNFATRYSLNLMKNKKFVFYTMTTGPKVISCVKQSNSDYKKCSKPSDKIILQFVPKETGIHYHYVYSTPNTKGGAHVSYVSILYKKMKLYEVYLIRDYVNSIDENI